MRRRLDKQLKNRKESMQNYLGFKNFSLVKLSKILLKKVLRVKTKQMMRQLLLSMMLQWLKVVRNVQARKILIPKTYKE
jgi:hypothetical protein